MELVQELKKIDKYKMALVEVEALIEKATEDEKNKIPKSFKQFIENNKAEDYVFKIDNKKSLLEQNFREETKILLSLIYRSYFCDKETKNKLEKKDFEYLKNLEDEKNKIYNSENLFKKSKEETLKNDGEKNKTVEMIKYKPSIFSRVINRIKLLFKREEF